jgi:hypothetical protein
MKFSTNKWMYNIWIVFPTHSKQLNYEQWMIVNDMLHKK